MDDLQEDHHEGHQEDHHEGLVAAVDLQVQVIILAVMGCQMVSVILNVEKVPQTVLQIVGQRRSHDTMNSVMMEHIV